MSKGKKEKNKDSQQKQDKIYWDGPEIDLSCFDNDEPEVFIDYVCVECGCIDPVPEFIVAECAYDLEPGEEPEFFCPGCNGTLVRKKEPTDN
ncbi:hypothetical protein D3C74_55780 [compost metagenome]